MTAGNTTERIHELVNYDVRIIEMSSANETINVPVDPRIESDILTADDANPMFVNLEVIRSGIMSGNNRRYNNGVVRQISEMTPGVQGYLGHPDPSKHGFEFREPHCIFVGSMIEEMDDGNVRSLAKAYIFKSSPLREWIPKSIAVQNPMTVSINGTADISRDSVNNIVEILRMNSLDSIDWANPGTEGVGTSQAYSTVKEMEGNQDMERSEVIKGVTIAELREHNQGIVSQIQEEAKITEMVLTVGGQEKAVKITELQGMISASESTIATLEGTIATMKSEAETAKITEYKAKKIAELVPEQFVDAITKRVVGATIQEIDNSITTELAFIQEIAGDRFSNPAKGKGQRTDIGDMEAKVKNLFGVKEK